MLSGAALLFAKLLILAAVFFGVRYLCKWLNVTFDEVIWKIFAAILVCIGAYWVFLYLNI
jgi:hypothetical protein